MPYNIVKSGSGYKVQKTSTKETFSKSRYQKRQQLHRDKLLLYPNPLKRSWILIFVK